MLSNKQRETALCNNVYGLVTSQFCAKIAKSLKLTVLSVFKSPGIGLSLYTGSFVVNSNAVSQEMPAGYSIGPPTLHVLPITGGQAFMPDGSKTPPILTASSLKWCGRVFQPNGYCCSPAL